MNNKIISKITSGMLLCTMIAYTTPILAYTKEETVYSKIDVNGNNYNTIVSNHLINDSKEDLINDLSDLFNIKNVNGSEEFTQDGTSLIWHTNGNDIYYQGESKKELPIKCKIHYELDGKEISAEDLAGKSGNVKITIEYINNDEHIVNINGKDEKLYTPFVAVCGTIINNEKNRNIKISNGKVIDDGTKTITTGISLPGFRESLGIQNNKVDIPNTIQITMDSTDFEFGNIYTFVSAKIIEDSDLNLFDNLDEIYSKVDTLQSSSNQLVNGANTLKNGTDTYFSKSKEFNNAMKQVSSGMNEAASNYSKIDDGISTLNQNTETLVSGSKKISDGTEAISDALNTMSEKVKTMQKGANQLEVGADTLSKKVNSFDTSKLPDASSITALQTAIQSDISLINMVSAYKDVLITSINNTPDMPAEQKQAMLGLLNNLATLKTGNQQANAQLSSLSSSLNALDDLSILQSGAKSLSAGANELATGIDTLSTSLDTLAEKTEELADGSKTLYKGSTAIADGTKTLNSGSSEMKKGLNTLNNGTTSLLDANNQLTFGANTLLSGANTLANGMNKFNKDGVNTISNYINGDVKDISIRLEKLQELADEYNNFTELKNDAIGNVKFIMIIDSIKPSDNSKENVIINDKKNETN